VVDIGCGWAELMLRVVGAAPDALGIGVDTDQAAIGHGAALAADRGLAERVTLVVGDGRTSSPLQAGAVICIGASQVWSPPVEHDQPLDYAGALSAIRAMVPRGAHVVFGEGVWSAPPTPAAVSPLSGRTDELVTLHQLVELAVAHGFMPVAVHEASIDDGTSSSPATAPATPAGSPSTSTSPTTRMRTRSALERPASVRAISAATAG
jgi:hypothetical protein